MIYRKGIKSDSSLLRLKRQLKTIANTIFGPRAIACATLFPIIANNCCAKRNIQ